VSAFILLAEYIKVEQPLDLVEQLYIFQSSLQFCLRADSEPDNDARSAAAEMTRRSYFFGYCILVNQSFLLGFPIIPIAFNSRRLRLPCPRSLWKKACDGSLEQDDIIHPGDLAVPHFDALRQWMDVEEFVLHTDPTPESVLVMTAIAIQRMQITKEASQLTSSTDLGFLEYVQFV
jgi:hypothetical protein